MSASLLKRFKLSGYNKPKRTPGHPTKSHIVVAKSGNQIKTIRFGQQGANTAGAPKEGVAPKKVDNAWVLKRNQPLVADAIASRTSGVVMTKGDSWA